MWRDGLTQVAMVTTAMPMRLDIKTRAASCTRIPIRTMAESDCFPLSGLLLGEAGRAGRPGSPRGREEVELPGGGLLEYSVGFRVIHSALWSEGSAWWVRE